MEQSSGSNQPTNMQTDTSQEGNVRTYEPGQPPRIIYNEYREPEEKYNPRGKRRPLELEIKENSVDEGKTLMLTSYDPQMIEDVIGSWKARVVRNYIQKGFDHNVTEMYTYLETFLGGVARAAWEAFKQKFPDRLQQDQAHGVNPMNFVNRVEEILLATSPNRGGVLTQIESIRKIEQLSIRNWKYIKPFLQDFLYHSCLAGCFYDEGIIEKLFAKLPDDLGKKIYTLYKATPMEPTLKNVSTAVRFIINRLVEECTFIKIQKQLKGEYSFCSEIYTPQKYGEREKEKRKYRKPYKNYKKYPRKQYYLRKSKARKPFLKKEHHVRRYRPERTYGNRLSCFICKQPNHLATNCPNKHNSFNREAHLVELFSEDLIEIDDNILETESIYSIVSEDIDLTDFIEQENTGFINEILEKYIFYKRSGIV